MYAEAVDRSRGWCYAGMGRDVNGVGTAMIHTAQVKDGGVELTLVSIDDENFFAVPFYLEPGDEQEVVSYIATKSEQDDSYKGFSKTYLEEKGAWFGTL